MKGSLIILLCFLLGVAVSVLFPLPSLFHDAELSTYALYLLLFLIGVGVGADRAAWETLRRAGWKVLLIPATVAIGSLVGAAMVTPLLFKINIRDALAVGAGFGYYSLSSIFITQLRGEALGLVALLSNLWREMLTLFLAPLLVKYAGRIAPIAAGGATAMDVTLPIIAKYSGKRFVPLAVVSGAVLTVVVPFLVVAILRL